MMKLTIRLFFAQIMVLLLSPWILIYFMLFIGRMISRGSPNMQLDWTLCWA